MAKLLFIDTETTGLSSYKNELFQIAGIISENRRILETFNIYVRPTKWDSISQQALDVTHKTVDELKTYPNAQSAFDLFKSIIIRHASPRSKVILSGQNVKSFDKRFLDAFWEHNRNGTDKSIDSYISNEYVIELMDLSKHMMSNGLLACDNRKLGTVMEALDIKPDGSLHDAMTDIKGTYDSIYKIYDILNELKTTDPTHQAIKPVEKFLLFAS